MGRNYMNAHNMKWKCACSQIRNVPNHAHCAWVYSRNLHAHRMGMKTCTHECRARMWNQAYTKPVTNRFMHRNTWRSWTKWLLKLSNPCQKLKHVPIIYKILQHHRSWNPFHASLNCDTHTHTHLNFIVYCRYDALPNVGDFAKHYKLSSSQ